MDLMFPLIVTLVNFEAPEKALSPMAVTLEPSVIVFNFALFCNAFLENMPYLDILFVFDHSANDLLGESLNIYQPAFKWIQNILNIKDNELDYDLLDKSSQTNVSNNINKDPNLIILNNIRNNETDNKQYNLLNIIDEIYNEQNYSLINVSNKYIEKICNLLNYRNNFISNLMV